MNSYSVKSSVAFERYEYVQSHLYFIPTVSTQCIENVHYEGLVLPEMELQIPILTLISARHVVRR